MVLLRVHMVMEVMGQSFGFSYGYGVTPPVGKEERGSWTLHRSFGFSGVMGEPESLDSRLACRCEVCLTWRRLGHLLGSCHDNEDLARIALTVLRFGANEIALSARHPGTEPPVAAGSLEPTSPEARGEVKEEEPPKEERRRRKRKKERSSVARSPSRQGEKERSHAKSPEKSESSRRKRSSRRRRRSRTRSIKRSPESPKEVKKEEKKSSPSKVSQAKKEGEAEQVRSSSPTSSAALPSQKSKAPRSPTGSPPRRSSGSARQFIKEEDQEGALGDSRPPGRWTLTLTESPSWGVAEVAPRPSSARLTPREPNCPPPGWVPHRGGAGPGRSKGVNRRERRAEDIRQHGPDPSRKQERLSRNSNASPR